MSEHTFPVILARMKERIETEADRREGTWTGDNLQAVANELARIYSEDIDSILPQAFVISATGKNLDDACGDYGILRREATRAEVLVELTGEPGTYDGLMVYAGELAFLVPATVTLQEGASVTARAVCVEAGEAGNVAAGSIDRASTDRVRVTNPEDAAGGYDTEDDEALRERALEHIRTPATSGNIAHYIQWAKEVPGVEKVRVHDLARGPGTVDVLLIADGNQPADQKLIEEVEEHIEEVRPIGADVRVTGAEAVDLHVEASVVVQRGYTAEAVEAGLRPLLQAMCEQLSFRSRTVSWLGIANLIFDCPGVVDVTEYTVNGSGESIRLKAGQFPVPGQIRITVQEETDA